MSSFAKNHPDLAAAFRAAVDVGTLVGAYFAACAGALATIGAMHAHPYVGASCGVLAAIGAASIVGVGGAALAYKLEP